MNKITLILMAADNLKEMVLNVNETAAKKCPVKKAEACKDAEECKANDAKIIAAATVLIAALDNYAEAFGSSLDGSHHVEDEDDDILADILHVVKEVINEGRKARKDVPAEDPAGKE